MCLCLLKTGDFSVALGIFSENSFAYVNFINSTVSHFALVANDKFQ